MPRGGQSMPRDGHQLPEAIPVRRSPTFIRLQQFPADTAVAFEWRRSSGLGRPTSHQTLSNSPRSEANGFEPRGKHGFRAKNRAEASA
ncbi:hypothetical protein FRAAL2410 [Frankia alni ACN14a]|uniref:Uncharacterized protein n=1 Tax=Frankia alni (strain DSM 45986 / CECT 9034 / ACN14a) TaxID=326424 RepID=Q0RN34_FRAAA|nr:hypothetical protein FRAAL2410 [Frankia alni ACN14a]